MTYLRTETENERDFRFNPLGYTFKQDNSCLWVYSGQECVLHLDCSNNKRELTTDDSIQAQHIGIYILVNRDLDPAFRVWAADYLKLFNNDFSWVREAFLSVFIDEYPTKELIKIIELLEGYLDNNRPFLEGFFRDALDPITAIDPEIKLKIIDLIVKLSDHVPMLVYILKDISSCETPNYKDEEDFIYDMCYEAYKALLALAKCRDTTKNELAWQIMMQFFEEVKQQSAAWELLEDDYLLISSLASPLFDESSEPNTSESDENHDIARAKALLHIKNIISGLMEMPNDKAELYRNATELARRDLHLGTGTNQNAINRDAQLSTTAYTAIQLVARSQKNVNCRHNPILRRAVILSRRDISRHSKNGVKFDNIVDSRGRIINENAMLQYGIDLYEDMRKQFSGHLLKELQRLQQKYQFNASDFEDLAMFAKWNEYLNKKISGNSPDFMELHHLAYKEKYPRTTLSTRNLELTRGQPRSPTAYKNEGTHSACHRMLAIGEKHIMRVEASQALDAYKSIISQRRKSKKDANNENGYAADDEAQLREEFEQLTITRKP